MMLERTGILSRELRCKAILTQVYFAPGSDKAAVQVIADLQLDAVVAQPLPAGPDEIRVALRSRNGADVVVILGN